MALRETTVKETGHDNLKFPEHIMAHTLFDNLNGLELGPSSHNSFNLLGSQAVAPKDGFDFYQADQIKRNGKFIEIDIWGDAENIPVLVSSQDYIISSHVLEHIPNLFKAFKEWERVLRSGGYVFMIVPQRDALKSDEGRDLTTFDDLYQAYMGDYTVATMSQEKTNAAGGYGGHYWVFTSQSLKDIIEVYNTRGSVNRWELFYEEDPDKKVGNGFTLVYKIIKLERETIPMYIQDSFRNAPPSIETDEVSVGLSQENVQSIVSAMGVPADIIDPPPTVKKTRKKSTPKV